MQLGHVGPLKKSSWKIPSQDAIPPFIPVFYGADFSGKEIGSTTVPPGNMDNVNLAHVRWSRLHSTDVEVTLCRKPEATWPHPEGEYNH